ncbi:EamA family transporter [Maritimibacter sp. 55A14]|uniref:DMT family transporter n=1 Tax=Maritimibacter sp. 55A14 TaxID=2174844 RepID=UPI000D60E6FE|nr:DMT family transporter [Maritimibacter sp. 55A14]PWE33667.1 EamA family transporter [Maritimibacter sp. 55A14]
MHAADTPGPGLTNWALIAALGVIWGASFMAVSVGLGGFGPFTIAAIRVSLAAVVLLGVVAATGRRLPAPGTREGRKVWLHCAGMGLFSNALPFFLLGWGQQHVASGFAGITMSAVPLLVLPLAHLLVPGERMTLRKGLGFVIGFCGVVLLIGPGALLDPAEGGTQAIARLACLGAAACYAIGSIITRLCPPVSQIAFGAAALSVASALLVPMALWQEGVPGAVPSSALAAVIYLGLGPTALATLMLVRVIRSAGPSFLSLVNYQVPVWSLIFGALVLSETLPPQFFAALGLILAGLVLSQWTSLRRALG